MKTTDAMSVDEGEGASEYCPIGMGIGRWSVAQSVQRATCKHGPVLRVITAHSVTCECREGSSSIDPPQSSPGQWTVRHCAVLPSRLAQLRLLNCPAPSPRAKGGHVKAAAVMSGNNRTRSGSATMLRAGQQRFVVVNGSRGNAQFGREVMSSAYAIWGALCINTLLSGERGNDLNDGGEGADLLNGEAGSDTLLGVEGDAPNFAQGVVPQFPTLKGGVQ